MHRFSDSEPPSIGYLEQMYKKHNSFRIFAIEQGLRSAKHLKFWLLDEGKTSGLFLAVSSNTVAFDTTTFQARFLCGIIERSV